MRKKRARSKRKATVNVNVPRNRKGVTTEKKGCTCEKCQSQCKYLPGLFTYGEVEKVAAYLKADLDSLFRTKLNVIFDQDPENPASKKVFCLIPGVKGQRPGTLLQERGECVFYNASGLCEIHPVKPYVCRRSWHDDRFRGLGYKAVATWDNPEAQAQVAGLLDRHVEHQKTLPLSQWETTGRSKIIIP